MLGFSSWLNCNFSVPILTPLREERVLWLCRPLAWLVERVQTLTLGDASAPLLSAHQISSLGRIQPNKFQPTLTMVKYLPAWHSVGDSQSLGMLQTGPLQAKLLPQREGRNAGMGHSLPFPGSRVLSPTPPTGSLHFCLCIGMSSRGRLTSCVFLC